MEDAANKLSKPSSNINELVTRFTKVCRLRSIGVLPSGNSMTQLQLNSCTVDEDSIGAVEEAKCDVQKVYSRPVEVPSKGVVFCDSEVRKLFDIVSAIKLAYVQLQEAHIPFSPEKIMAADELIVSELEALGKIKRVLKEKQMGDKKSGLSYLRDVRARVEAVEKCSEKLKADIIVKDLEIHHLRQELLELNLVNDKLVEELRKKISESRKVRANGTSSIQEIFVAASIAIHEFAKPLISLMKAAGWDLDMAAEFIEGGVVYSKRSHKKYAFEAYVSRRMFHEISHKPYNIGDIMKYDDPFDALMAYPDSEFAHFSGKKYLAVIHPNMEISFFGNLDQRTFVMNGKHPRTPFYQAFAEMAKCVWVLLGIAASASVGAEMFSVNRGCVFSDIYMESVEENCEGTAINDEKATRRVAFMVMPGFVLGDGVVKSLVYVSRSKS